MLTYLPKPYDDELLYSIIARYFAHVGGLRGGSIEQFFGRRSVTAQVDLPCSLGRFAENAAPLWGLTAENIAERHTLFPYYTYFANETVKKEAMKTIVSERGTGLHSILGINRSLVRIPQFLRYCPECVSQDFDEWGETYWRRAHQLPGVLVCTDHKGWLANSAVPYRPNIDWDFIDASEAARTAKDFRLELTNECSTNAWKVARKCEDILLRKENRWSCDDKRRLYREAAMNAGFSSGGKIHAYREFLNQQKLEQSFVDFFGFELLTAIDCHVHQGQGVSTNWLREIFRAGSNSRHPVQHALLQIFLEEMPESGEDLHPFGHGPWKCPNTYCNQDTAEPIRSIEVRSDRHGKLVASAWCGCGFRFSFRSIVGGKPIVDKIVMYGPTWTEKAKALVGSGISRDAASKVLQVSRPVLNRFIDKKSQARKNGADEEKIRSWRKEWQLLLEQVPGRSREAARRLNKTLYDRLRRRDHEWLFSEPRRFVGKKDKRSPADWDASDRRLVERIRAAAQELRENVPLKRASREGILKQARVNRLTLKKKDKLPLFATALSELEESVEDFCERRLKRAVVIAPERGLPLKAWALLKLTRLKEKDLTPRLAILVEELLSSSVHGNL